MPTIQPYKGGLLRQSAAILSVSALVGLAFNALNPAGLSWHKPSAVQDAAASNSRGGRLYQVETVSARLVFPDGASQALPAIPMISHAPERTTWDQARARIESGQAVLVDSRSRRSYEAGHIPGAVNLPEKELESAIGDFLVAHLPPDTHLVIYCANEKCASSAKLASALYQDYGYDHVQYVPGGYLEWRRTQNTSRKS